MSGQNLNALVRQFQDSSEDQQRALLEAIQEKEHHLRILNNFAVSLIGISSLDDLYWYVVKEVVGQLGFVDCVLYTFDDANRVLVQRAAMGDKSPVGRTLLNPLTIPLGKGVTGRAAATRQPILVEDLHDYEGYIEDLSPARSEICVPLLHGNELLGVIDCEDPAPGAFTEVHLDRLVMVASMTSSKIQERKAVRKLTEQAQIIRQVREAVVITDMEGTITECNGGALALYEFDRAELIGRHVTDLLADVSIWQKAHVERTEALDSRGLWRGFEEVITGTGKRVTVDISLTPITDDFGNRIATIGVGRDVTALEDARKALTAKNEALEQALVEREAARSESRAKDAFLANTSHELRTPLTGLIGMVDMLAETELTEEQREIVAAASASAHGLTGIIDDILDLAKIEAGKVSFKSRPFDPVSLVQSAGLTMAVAAEAKGLDFVRQWPDHAPFWLEGDANRIRQVIFNLLGNAVKFTEVGTVSLECSLEADGPLADFRVTVSDTGRGFPQESYGHIFDRFHQLDTSQRKSAGGAGLGLAISKELVCMMGGDITVESVPGKGSSFTFHARLPRCEAPDDGATRTPQAPKRGLTGLRILVVEDHFINQALVTKIIGKAGATYVVANNGREALDVLEGDGAFDLVLMDIRMPVMDGETATRRLREMPGHVANLPVIALTANAQPLECQQYLAVGMNAVVAKPINRDELIETARKLTTGQAGP